MLQDLFDAVYSHAHAQQCDLILLWFVQIDYVMGLKYLYRLHVFYYSLFACVGLTLIYLIVRGPDRWKRYKVEDAYVV